MFRAEPPPLFPELGEPELPPPPPRQEPPFPATVQSPPKDRETDLLNLFFAVVGMGV